MRVLITGASGFVGKRACPYLANIGHKITANSRKNCAFPLEIKFIQGKNLFNKYAKDGALKGYDCVVHLAGRTSNKDSKNKNSYSEYFKDNVQETLKLAEFCAKSSVKRFIFMSSIKVNGESTEENMPFTENDIPNPQDYYAKSKYEAELGLLKIAKKSNMEVVIVRPPLIYGEGVKGYFRILLKLIKLKIPIPFGSFNKNKRSFIYIENLLNFISVLIDHPQAGNQVFLCSDYNDMSTADLIREISYGMHNRDLIFKFPKFFLLSSYLFGKGYLYKKLSESLTIDYSKAAKLLGWYPPITTKHAIKRVSKEFIEKFKLKND